MPAILRLFHQLDLRPADPPDPPALIRTYAGEQDIDRWLAIRNAAFAFLGVRPWSTADFRREFLDQPWWSAATLWLAEVCNLPQRPAGRPAALPAVQAGQAAESLDLLPRTVSGKLDCSLPAEAATSVGTVVLAPARMSDSRCAALRWLAVHPAWQRRGIAKLLVTRAEQAAWDAGWRRIIAETHARWHAAVAFYKAYGYAAVEEERRA